MPKITIDGKDIEAKDGATILEVCRENDISIPTLCYYDRLSKAGTCRMCLVEVEKVFKLQTACTTDVREGMVVYTNNEKVKKARRGVLEFLLLNHPLDCPVCDQAGDCELQDLVYEFGASDSRYKEEKLTYEKIGLGPNIIRDMNRCINCRRCVRLTWEELKTYDFGATERGNHTVIGPYIDSVIEGEFIGNVIDVCPVGALTDKNARFKSRVWDLDEIPAHRKKGCPHGCKVSLGVKGGKIVRVTSRKNGGGVIEELICDKCRFEHFEIEDWVLEV